MQVFAQINKIDLKKRLNMLTVQNKITQQRTVFLEYKELKISRKHFLRDSKSVAVNCIDCFHGFIKLTQIKHKCPIGSVV